MFERFSLVRCEDALPYLASIRGIVGNYQDDKDILTTGLVFNDKTLNLYKNSFLVEIVFFIKEMSLPENNVIFQNHFSSKCFK